MANTYIVRVTNQDDFVYNGELPVYQVAGQPAIYTTFIPKAYAWLSLFNAVGSGYVAKIKSIGVERWQVYNTAATNICTIEQCSAMSGGTSFPVTALDSTAAALPAQVIIADKPTCTTGADIGYFRHLFQNTALTASFPGRRFGDRGTILFDEILRSGYGSATTQGFILREGHGVSIRRDNNVFASDVRVEIRFLFNVGSSTYIASKIVGIDQRTALVGDMIAGIHNGTGSGIVIDLKQISMTEVGTLEVGHFSVEPIMETEGGTSVTPIKLDSTAPDLPAGVTASFKPVVVIRSPSDGVCIASPTLRRFVVSAHGVGEQIASTTLVHGAFNDEIFSGDYVMEPGTGLAVIQRSPATWGACDFKFVFTVEPATSSGSGSKSRYAKPGHSGMGFR